MCGVMSQSCCRKKKRHQLALSAPSASPFTRSAWLRPVLAVDLLKQRVPNSSAVHRRHTDALHGILSCLSAAGWLATLPSDRSWLTVTHGLGPDR